MHPKMKHVYVGVDTHRQNHTAAIINCFGDRLGEVTFDNKPSAFTKLISEVKKHTGDNITAVYGLEDVKATGRALATFLAGRKQDVRHVNPSLTYSERRNQTILHKTDSFDALCISRVLLNKLDELPQANPQDIYWALSQLVVRRRVIVKASTALRNQIHAFILHNYPSYSKFFYSFSSKTALEFFEKYPSPSKLKGTSSEELGKFLKHHSANNYSEKKAEEILKLVEADGDTYTEHQEMRDYIISLSIRELKHNNMVIAEIEEQMENIMATLDYKLESLKGIDLVTAASLIAEIGDIERFSSAAKLAKYAGVAPITYSSGKTDKLFSNRRGDRTLNKLFLNIASILICHGDDNKKPAYESFHTYFNKKISEGKTRKQALKCVMRRLVNIVYSMMKNKSEYIAG